MRRRAVRAPEWGTRLNALLLIGSIRLLGEFIVAVGRKSHTSGSRPESNYRLHCATGT